MVAPLIVLTTRVGTLAFLLFNGVVDPRAKSTISRYVVYLLLCKNGRIYTGITTDLARRFAEHKLGKGARYTRAFGAVKIIYAEKATSKSAALRREHEIKKLSAAQKRRLSENTSVSFSSKF